jgi:hypothetical protein
MFDKNDDQVVQSWNKRLNCVRVKLEIVLDKNEIKAVK